MKIKIRDNRYSTIIIIKCAAENQKTETEKHMY